MDKKEKNAFGKIPNKPYFVWIVIVCAIIMLVSLPRGGSGNVQTLDTKQRPCRTTPFWRFPCATILRRARIGMSSRAR